MTLAPASWTCQAMRLIGLGRAVLSLAGSGRSPAWAVGIALIFPLVPLTLLAAPPARLIGTLNAPQENGCLYVSLFFFRVDCSYSRVRSSWQGREIPWVGPTVNAVYYRRDSAHAGVGSIPEIGDDRVAPAVSASIAIDDRGTAIGTDDRLGGQLVVGEAARNVLTRVAAGAQLGRAVESWSRVVHQIQQTPVDDARPNDFGGFDYIVGKSGFPDGICRRDLPNDCFPSATAPATADGRWGAGFWQAPAAVPITRGSVLGSNLGTRTTAKIDGYACNDANAGVDCARGVGLLGPAAGFTNLLLRVRTDRQSHVIAVEGLWTVEYRIGGPPATAVAAGEADSWFGGYLRLTADEPLTLP